MANTYGKMAVHLVFAVKNREALIPVPLLPKFHRFIGGAIRKYNERCFAFAVGGTSNHVHVLLNLSPAVSLSELVKAIKVASNRFVNQEFGLPFRFEWQRGFAGISVSPSHIDAVVNYINSQMEHHHGIGMREEIRGMFRRAGVEIDEQYIFEEV